MFRNSVVGFLILFVVILAGAAGADMQTGVIDQGVLGLTVANWGTIGHAFSQPYVPSCEYPRYSGGEHLYLAGIWVGARNAAGERLVSTSAEDANGIQTAIFKREFVEMDDAGASSIIWMSNNINSYDYHPDALAPIHVECRFKDLMTSASGDHTPLGVEVTLRALAWATPLFDDFVVLDYTITNVSGSTLRDVYVGFFNDTTVGNINYRNPYDYDYIMRWIFSDDLNGAWRPGDDLDDPTLWMMHEHDADGDEGWATSWVGCRLLGTEPQVAAPFNKPPVSYNCWRYSHVPDCDDSYYDISDPTTLLPGKYQIMSNGDFDIGVTDEADYTAAGNWLGLLSTGPFPILAAGESVRVTFALVLGMNQDQLRYHSRLAKLMYDYEYEPPVSGVEPPSDARFHLAAATPNPFNPSTTLSFEMADPGHVRLTVFDAAGRQVIRLVDEHRNVGRYDVVWDGRDTAGRMSSTGIYLYRLEIGDYSKTKRMILLK